MKKVLLSVFAIAALASCMQDDILGTAQGTAISFDNAYVDNATKAIDSSFNNNNLEEFQVYGTVTNTANEVANIFPGIAVVKGGAGVGANWAYDAQYTQYWVANNYYNFTAIVAGNEAGETKVEVDTNGMPKAIKVEDAEAQNDVLFAQVGPVNYVNNVQAVKFTFKHLLAKAKVSVRNIMDVNNGNYYVVKDVKITNAHKSATYTIGEGWGSYADAYVLPFGDIVAADATAADAVAIQLPKDGYGVSTYERLLVPQQNCAFTISVDYVLYQSGVQIDTKEELTVSTNATIEAGKSYNFALTLGNPGEPITFDVEAVEDWKDGGSIYDVQTAKVTTAAELATALADANVGAVVLMNDIELSSSITRNGEAAGATIAKEFILDGNGNTLTYTGSGANARAIEISNAEDVVKNVTIKDLTINCTASYCQRGINYNDNGSLVLDNVKVLGTNVTYALNCPGLSDGAKVTVKNSELTANIALNVWGENMWINVENSILTSVDNSTAEGYAAVSFNNDGTTAAVGTVANFYGGKIEARDENGEPACAIRNAALAGVNLNDTEVIGATRVPCVIIAYEGYDQFYSLYNLQDAIDKVQKDKNGTLRLTSDITLEEFVTVAKSDFKVVLDLNGHTISGTSTSTENVALFTVNGTLDVQGNGIISLTGNNFAWNTSYRYTAINVRESGVVTLGEGVSVVCEASKDGNYGMSYAVDIYTTGKLNINGATLRSNYIAVRCFYGNAVVNVGSGSIIRSTHANNYGIWLQSAPGAVVTIAEDVEYTKSDDGSLYYFN